MIRPIKFKLLAHDQRNAVLRILVDTYVGHTYEGNFIPAGTKAHGITHAPNPLDKDIIVFMDSVDEMVTSLAEDLQIEEIDPPANVTMVKPKVRVRGNNNRQFDIKFKRKVVKQVQKLREGGGKGTIKAYLQTLDITPQHAAYWAAQDALGQLKKGVAVAFSTSPSTMVKG